MSKRRFEPEVCKHALWELIEDSGYWMFQCLFCGVCHEIDNAPIWIKEDILNRDWEEYRKMTTWVKENETIDIYNQS